MRACAPTATTHIRRTSRRKPWKAVASQAVTTTSRRTHPSTGDWPRPSFRRAASAIRRTTLQSTAPTVAPATPMWLPPGRRRLSHRRRRLSRTCRRLSHTRRERPQPSRHGRGRFSRSTVCRPTGARRDRARRHQAPRAHGPRPSRFGPRLPTRSSSGMRPTARPIAWRVTPPRGRTAASPCPRPWSARRVITPSPGSRPDASRATHQAPRSAPSSSPSSMPCSSRRARPSADPCPSITRRTKPSRAPPVTRVGSSFARRRSTAPNVTKTTTTCCRTA